jgi:hypothetical protein
MIMKKQLLTLLGATALSVASSQAAVVVDWGGDYVTTNQNMAGSSTILNTDLSGGAGRSRYMEWNSAGTLANPAAGYTAPTGKTANIYNLGFVSTWSGTPGANAAANANRIIGSSSSADVLRFQAGANVGTGGTVSNVSAAFTMAFKASDFLVNPAQAYGFDSNSSISMTLTASPTTYTTRLMVQVANQWYLSSSTAPTTGASPFTLTLNGAALTGNQWAAFTPTSGTTGAALQSMFFNPTGATFSTLDTSSGIQALGFYTSYSNTVATNTSIDIRSFTADLAAVPEPSTWALLAIGLTAVVIFRRRRQQA